MFLSSTKTTENQDIKAPATLIGTGTVITGNIDAAGDIRIDGVLKGNLTGRARIIIGPESYIEGDITGQFADIEGKVEGRIQVKELLHLKGKAIINGDIHASKLLIEPTASFNG